MACKNDSRLGQICEDLHNEFVGKISTKATPDRDTMMTAYRAMVDEWPMYVPNNGVFNKQVPSTVVPAKVKRKGLIFPLSFRKVTKLVLLFTFRAAPVGH